MNISIIIDLVFILIALVIVQRNYKQGFLTAAIKLVAVFISWMLAAKLAPIIAVRIYNSYLRENIILFISENIANAGINIENAGLSIEQIIAQAFGDGRLSEIMQKLITMGANAEITQNILANVADAGEISQKIELSIVGPIVINVVKTVAYIVIFFVTVTILNIIARVCKIVNKLPLIGGLNHLLGGAMGIIIAFLSVCVVCVILNLLVVILPADNGYLTMEILEGSKIYGYLKSIQFISMLNGIV